MQDGMCAFCIVDADQVDRPNIFGLLADWASDRLVRLRAADIFEINV
jgi:hypothetical protein